MKDTLMLSSEEDPNTDRREQDRRKKCCRRESGYLLNDRARMSVGCSVQLFRKLGTGVLEIVDVGPRIFGTMRDVFGGEMKNYSFEDRSNYKIVDYDDALNGAINDIELFYSLKGVRRERLGILLDQVIDNIRKSFIVRPIARRQQERRRCNHIYINYDCPANSLVPA